MNCENPVIIYNRACDRYFQSGVVEIHSRLQNYIIPFVSSPYWHSNGHDILKKLNNLAHYVQPEELPEHYLLTSSGKQIRIFMQVPCGHCELCKSNKRLTWQTRCLMESAYHYFRPTMLTLTYDDAHLPENGVNTDDVAKFFKRLRISLQRYYGQEVTLTYIIASEYGSGREYIDLHGRLRKATFRPHYHALVWGFPSQCYMTNSPDSELSDAAQALIFGKWGNCQLSGFQCEQAHDRSGSYVCKYITKDCPVPEGKNKTFVHASRRPSIGWRYYEEMLKDFVLSHPDQPKYNVSIFGNLKEICIPPYFLQKTFKPFSSHLPKKFRDAYKTYCYYKGILADLDRLGKLTGWQDTINCDTLYSEQEIEYYLGFLSGCHPRVHDPLHIKGREIKFWKSRQHLHHEEIDNAIAQYEHACETLNEFLNNYKKWCGPKVGYIATGKPHPRCTYKEFEDMHKLIDIKYKFQFWHKNDEVLSPEDIAARKLQLKLRYDKENSKDNFEFVPIVSSVASQDPTIGRSTPSLLSPNK